MRKLSGYLCCLFTVICASGALGWVEWNYTGGSHSWNNAANWGGAVPTSSGDPIMRGQGAGNEAMIEDTVAAVGHTMWIGYSGRADLNITGGSLNITSGLRLGQTFGTANVNVSGGTVTAAGDMVVGDGGSGTATLTITGGSVVNSGGWLYIGYLGATGTIHLDGGSLTAYNIQMGSGHPLIDITGGKLIITNYDSVGVRNILNGFIEAGKITFFGGDLRATYSIRVNGSGYTELTASMPSNVYASNPSPVNLATQVTLVPTMSWSAGAGATSHDIYFGSTNPGTFRGNQSGTTFNCGTLAPGTTYYWRIDEKYSGGTTKGNLWQFTTITLPWSEGFESGNFISGGWSNGGTVSVSGSALYSGSYGARIAGSSTGANYIKKLQSTQGYNGISVKYDRRITSSTVSMTAEWSSNGGSSWTTLETVSGSAGTVWLTKTWNLGAGAANNANFAVRFRTTAGSSSYYAYVDNVSISAGSAVNVTVPSLGGMSQSAAQAAIAAACLSFGAVSQQYSNTVAAGNVISQSPPAGASVGYGSEVDLVISLGKPVVPNVIGLTQVQAAAAITAVDNLKTGVITRQYSNTVAAGLVISQDPAAGTAVNTGSSVNLVISLGEIGVLVPALTGMTQGAALTTLESAGLVCGTVMQKYCSTVGAGNVVSQSPAAGTNVGHGVTVDIIVSLGAPSGEDSLYQGFVNPPSSAGPDVYWFWNANALSEAEISRELDVLKGAGIQGVLIFPLQEPMAATQINEPPLQWLSPKWCSMLKYTIDAAKMRDMHVDLLVGTGWPFGGPFVGAGDQIKIIKLGTTTYTGPGTFNLNVKNLMVLPPGAYGETNHGLTPQLEFLRLVPKNPSSFIAGTELKDQVRADGSFSFTIPSGDYILYTGTYREGFLVVNIAAPGGEGPVIDHLSGTALTNYLTYFENALKPYLGDKIGVDLRSLHCDSFELTNANWTADLAEEFLNRRGYSIEPYLPFIIEWPPASGGTLFNDTVNRVQYDLWKTQQEVFNERFIMPFYNWCHKNGTDCQMEGYGCYEIDSIQNKLVADRPMGETWIALDRDIPTSEVLIPVDPQVSATNVGIWSCRANKYESSAAHLAGRPQVSCEAMTSGSAAFRLRLQDIKIAADMDFVSGINHTVYHGFNWSPPEAGFPGWFYCGSYIDNKELFWPWLGETNKYISRLSYIFQKSVSRSQGALMSWENFLWEGLAQNGYGVDYISESIICNASFEGGKINYGQQSYDILIMNSIDAIEPETASAMQNFAAAGGKIVFIGRAPAAAPGLVDSVNRNYLVNSRIGALISQYPDRVKVVAGSDSGDWLSWVPGALAWTGIKPAVQISKTDELLYQVHHSAAGKEIFFFANLDVTASKIFEAKFSLAGMIPWCWDPMTGSRHGLEFNSSTSTLNVKLGPGESLLVVFEPNLAETPAASAIVHEDDYFEINTPWDLTLNRVSDAGGNHSVSYDVYFGTDYNAVNAAYRLVYDFNGDGVVDWLDLVGLSKHWLLYEDAFDLNQDGCVSLADFAEFAGLFGQEAPPEFQCNQAAAVFKPGSCAANTTYYWRVDKVSGAVTYKGPVWSFTTGP